MIISLIGFMGCGKSSVGRRLSELLCCPFMDLDAVIEQQTGRSIPEIFATDGEAAFRQMELEVLESVLKQSLPSQAMGPSLCGQRGSTVLEHSLKPSTAILSLGGGTVTQERCAEIVKKNTACIYLQTSVETLVERLSDEAAGRPLLSSGQQTDSHQSAESALRSRIETLMAQRSAIYESTAHHIIDTDGLSIDSVAQSIFQAVRDGIF